ncbi:MAG TPA: hypothetical protein PK188_08165 [Thermosynergistes sp.]|nr:hypothetical protein [Thermosynergistes sp.]HPP38160.1 hypothetical protein [Thermosynergistes sp.]
MKRIAIPDAETFVAAIQDEISRTREGRYFHRLHVVLYVLQGASPYEAARLYGDSPRAPRSAFPFGSGEIAKGDTAVSQRTGI